MEKCGSNKKDLKNIFQSHDWNSLHLHQIIFYGRNIVQLEVVMEQMFIFAKLFIPTEKRHLYVKSLKKSL